MCDESNTSTVRRLAVIGAGPKGLAIAAKAKVLNDLGMANLEVVLFEKRGVAANWHGKHGFTDGHQTLGTPADKDITFPHRSAFGTEVVRRMLDFSWMHYRVLGTADFAAWIDSGRPQPSHSDFAAYLSWLAERIPANCVTGEVKYISPRDDGTVDLTFSRRDVDTHAKFDGVVFTGPGDPIRLPRQYDGDHVIDGRRYWQRREIFRNAKKDTAVAVIGGGETAATILVNLLRNAPQISPTLINRHGLTYSRGESPSENELYTNPDKWIEYDEFQREEFIKRTDRGVFSLDAIAELRKVSGKSYRPVSGNVEAVLEDGDKIAVSVTRGKSQLSQIFEFDYVIVALGFDPISPLMSMLPNHLRSAKWAASLRKDRDLDDAFRIRLFDDQNRNAGYANIHLPMLAGLRQGPGFPNLSCLGLLSDRILRAYAPLHTVTTMINHVNTSDTRPSSPAVP